MEKVCCRCKRNQDGDRWVKPKTDEKRLVSYGLCPTCYQHTLSVIQKAYEFRFQSLTAGGVN